MFDRRLIFAAVVAAALVTVTVLKPFGSRVTPPAGAPSAARCPNQTAPPSRLTVTQWRQATICLLNAERSKHHLRLLQLSSRLTRAGTTHAAREDEGDYMSHTEPNGSTIVSRAYASGYLPGDGRWHVGEDLAWGRGPGGSPRDVVAAWMQSPPHRHEILTSSYRDLGLGTVRGAPRPNVPESGTLTIAAEFGHR